MKIITILFLVSISFNVFSQKLSKQEQDLYKAGQYLEKATKQANNSFMLGGICMLSITGQALMNSFANDPNAYSTHFYFVGAIAGIASIVYRISAWKQIGKAGILMQQYQQGFSINSNNYGIGIAYRF